MSGEGADLQLGKEAVAKFTQGVGATIEQLGELGGATGSVMGKGFSELAMTGMEAGHHGLSVDFEDFCERWEWGVRALVHDASEIANRLGLAAGTQWEHDQFVAGSLKVGVNALMGGNPHASEEEITQQDWGDVFTPDYLDPDWSAGSFADHYLAGYVHRCTVWRQQYTLSTALQRRRTARRFCTSSPGSTSTDDEQPQRSPMRPRRPMGPHPPRAADPPVTPTADDEDVAVPG